MRRPKKINESSPSHNGEFIRPTSTLKWAAVLAFLSQAVITLAFFRRGIYADQFDFVPLLKSMIEGDNWLASVFLPHGDHWHTGAYILMLPMAYVSNWSLLPEALIILLISLTGWLFLQSLVKSTLEESKQLAVVFPFIFVFLYFLPSNAVNLLWTWQMATYLVIFGLVVMFYGFTKVSEKPFYFLLAITGAVIGSVSFGTGFALWPVGLVVLTTYPNLQARKRLLLGVIWLVTATTVTGTFILFKGSTFSAGVTIDPLLNLKFLVIYLGATLAIFSRDLGNVLGISGLVLFFTLLIVIAQHRDEKTSKALALATALGLFAILAGVLISMGRIELGLDQARSSRYMIFSSMFWIAICILLYRYSFINAGKTDYRTIYKNSILGIFITIFLFAAFSGQRIARGEIRRAISFNAALISYINESSGPTDFFLYPNDKRLKRYLAYLKTKRLNIYR